MEKVIIYLYLLELSEGLGKGEFFLIAQLLLTLFE